MSKQPERPVVRESRGLRKANEVAKPAQQTPQDQPAERPVVRESRGLRKTSQVEAAPDRRWMWLAGGLGVLALVVLGLLWSRQGTAGADLSAVIEYPGLEQGHQSGLITYEQTPPAGGVHNGAWQNCGIYDEPIASENAVHSLEHGAVWITYDPNLPAEDVETLRNHVRARPYTLLSPYEGLPTPIVLTAWGHQLQVGEPDDPRISLFIRQYRQGPQTLEPGALCTGAIGEPIES